MTSWSDIVSIAVREGRDLRFWHNATRVTLSPYLYGLTAGGGALVGGITSDGRSVLLDFSEMIGVEIVPRRALVNGVRNDAASATLAS